MIGVLKNKALIFFHEYFEKYGDKFGSRHNKIFIIPTRYGLYFIAIVFILFLISLSYGHSLAYTTTFVFVALVMTSAHFTNYNLSGIEVIAIHPPDETFENEDPSLKVTLRNVAQKHRFDIFLKVSEYGESESFSLAPGETVNKKLTLNPLTRGEYQLKRLTIATSFPFGLFYAWKYWYQNQGFFIYPAMPEKSVTLPPPQALDNRSGSFEGKPEVGAEEFYGHQNYDIGMPLRSIDWKAYARGKGLLLKKFIDQSDVKYSLALEDTTEKSIQELTAKIVLAELSGATYAVILEQEAPKFGHGLAFKSLNFKRLATFQKEKQVLL